MGEEKSVAESIFCNHIKRTDFELVTPPFSFVVDGLRSFSVKCLMDVQTSGFYYNKCGLNSSLEAALILNAKKIMEK